MWNNLLPVFNGWRCYGCTDQFKIGRPIRICANIKMIAKMTQSVFQSASAGMNNFKVSFRLISRNESVFVGHGRTTADKNIFLAFTLVYKRAERLVFLFVDRTMLSC